MHVPVYKGRVTVVAARLGVDLTGDTLTSQIRVRPEQTSDLIATWSITVTSAAAGEIEMTLDDSANAITATEGFMDIKRMHAGQELPVFDEPLMVKFVPAVTA